MLRQAGHAACRELFAKPIGITIVRKVEPDGGSSWRSAEPGERGVGNFPASSSLVVSKQKFVN